MHALIAIVGVIIAILGIVVLAKKSLETDDKFKIKYVKEHRKVVGGVLLVGGAALALFAAKKMKDAKASAPESKFFYF
jgi:hypothetical protein